MSVLLPLAALLPLARAHGLPPVLVLYDSDEPGTSTELWRQAVDDLGPHLELSWVDETQWDGSNPPARAYLAVIHLNGVEGDKVMPEDGRAALDAYVRGGGGYIHASWDAREVDAGELEGLEDLTLFTHGREAEGPRTLTPTAEGLGHPVLQDLSGGLSFTGGYDAGALRAFGADPAVVLMEDEDGHPAVAVRALGAGRVVGMHHAGNHGGYPVLETPELQVLYRNAIWWAARCDDDADGDMIPDCGGLDCAPEDPAVRWGAEEVCNGLDDDCDGEVDGASASDAGFWYLDGDGDGHGTILSVVAGCEAPEGYVPAGDDCDDGDDRVYPGAPERWYDGEDQGCDEASDHDADGDGFDSASHGGEDCDDGDPRAFPGGERDCALADPQDADGDGFPREEDCDDHHSGAFPGGEERWYDGVDQDCDGNDLDADGDGHDAEAWGGDDCDDTDPEVSPSAEDAPYDGVIVDCVPEDEDDADGDGHDAEARGGDDCDDTDPDISPSAEELWYDGVDQDCDGRDDDQDGDGVPLARDCDDRDPRAGDDPACRDTGETPGGCGGCGGAGGAGWAWLAALVALGGRARRLRAPRG